MADALYDQLFGLSIVDLLDNYTPNGVVAWKFANIKEAHRNQFSQLVILDVKN